VEEEGVAQVIVVISYLHFATLPTVMGEMAAKSLEDTRPLLHLLEEMAAITIATTSFPVIYTVVMAGLVETSAAEVSVLEEREEMAMLVIDFAVPMAAKEVSYLEAVALTEEMVDWNTGMEEMVGQQWTEAELMDSLVLLLVTEEVAV